MTLLQEPFGTTWSDHFSEADDGCVKVCVPSC